MMTYESAKEAQVLQSFWRPGAALENTLFVILDPSGRPLTRGMRSPGWLYYDAQAMAAGLNQVAAQYKSNLSPQSLPTVATVRLAVNVAACDKKPLLVVVSDYQQERRAMEAKLAPLSWRSDLIGEMTYSSGGSRDLSTLQGQTINRGYLFVLPNEFGSQGTVVAQLYPTASAADLERTMLWTMSKYNPQHLDHREHIRQGRAQGITWQSALPVSDPHNPPAGGGPPVRFNGR
ncbi:MAG: hypothetical protein JSS83_16965 [Cyanobacteria bacterium SZAS LIN-3]|nr:hypothetical protein [Cyanobacteria bacterium SZAS LIN-3]MBS2010738.1 hypothetical protein [Cyanobacteria bacterium SZAS TMP-1]